MKKMLFAVALLALLSVNSYANDNASGSAVVSEPLEIADAGSGCGPVPPPAASAPAPAVCAAPTPTPAVCAAPDESKVFYEVPVKKQVKAQEVYTVNEKRTKNELEVRTKVIKPNSPRLVRTARGGPGSNPVKVHRDLPREKTYLKPVKTVYEVPVTKTRDITIEVEEMTLVPAAEMRRR